MEMLNNNIIIWVYLFIGVIFSSLCLLFAGILREPALFMIGLMATAFYVALLTTEGD